MITKDEFLKKYNIAEADFEDADISWEDLCDIFKDFSDKRDQYDGILEEFVGTYLKDINKDLHDNTKQVNIHSIRSRVKDPEHLLRKIIQRKQKNRLKYSNLDKNNYEKFVTDLIGIRCLILFKEDWENFHYYLTSKFENNADKYIRDSLKDFDNDNSHFYIAEKPKVHIRNGDAREIYKKVLSPDCILDGKVYRSVHYIIKYQGIYLEIQVRTLFEEGWGEIDHALVYPDYKDDEILKSYTELLNRLSGLADEMSGFFCRLKKLEKEYLEKGYLENTMSVKQTKEDTVSTKSKETKRQKQESGDETRTMATPEDCLQSVLDE